MSLGNKYLKAAQELLLRYRKPMHYSTIATAAIELGLLETDSKNAEIIMSTVLSREIARNPQSIIQKVKEGVYRIPPSARFDYDLAAYEQLGERASYLKDILGLNSHYAVIRRSLFLLRRVLECTDGNVSLLNDITLSINVSDLDGTRKAIESHVNQCRHLMPEEAQRLVINSDVLIAAEELRERCKCRNVHCIISFAVLLLEYCASFHKNGYIRVVGNGLSYEVRITSRVTL